MSVNEAFEDSTIRKPSEDRQNIADNLDGTSERHGVWSEDTPSGPAEEDLEQKENSFNYLQVFRYTNGIDKLLMAFGSIAAIVSGCCSPFNVIVYGNMASVFIYNDIFKNKLSNGSSADDGMTKTSTNDTRNISGYSDVYEFGKQNAIYTIYIFITSIVSCFCASYAWSLASARTVKTIRRLYFRSLMRQDISWYDKHRTGEIAFHFNQDMYTIAEGTGIKTANFVQLITTFLSSYIVALNTGWQLALIGMSFMILTTIFLAAAVRVLRTVGKQELKAYEQAGIVAEEAISSIRTVIAFGGQQKEYNRYENRLINSMFNQAKKGLVVGVGWGVNWIAAIVSIVLIFWQGLRLFQDEDPAYDPGNSLIVFFVLYQGSSALSTAFPTYETLTGVSGAAQRIFKIIDQPSNIDPLNTVGETPEAIKGSISFDNVHFYYPCRSGYQVFNGLSITIREGETAAIVGPSGCGKSSFIQLVQRLYDPQAGKILLDNKNLMDFNVKWLRNSIGVVSQEPVLFATTIEENIRYGRLDATQAEIQEAARNANAHYFIEKLPQKYQTVLGEVESKLSGGQKQRIAMARALLRNPKILLLDEATSALDYESETSIQSYLENDKHNRTTIIVAHRLSTIRNVDTIYVMFDGRVIGKGTHDELMLKNAYYKSLIDKQTANNENQKSVTAIDPEMVGPEQQIERSRFTETPSIINSAHPKESTQRRLTLTEISTGIKMDTTKRRKISATAVSTGIKNENAKDGQVDTTLMKILRINSKNLYLLAVTGICSVVNGCTYPVFAVVLAHLLKVFTFSPDQQNAKYLEGVGYSVALALVAFTFRVLATTMNARFGASLTLRFRLLAFKSLIWQDVSYFDDPENHVGALTSRLSTDTAKIQTATGSMVVLMIESFTSVVCMFVIGFMFSWKMTLAICPFLPVIMFAGFIQNLVLEETSKRDTKRLEEIGQLCIEAVEKIRTVASLTRENFFVGKINSYIDHHYRTLVFSNITVAVLYSISHSVRFGMQAVPLWYGGYIIQYEGLPFENIIKIFGAFLYGGISIGSVHQYLPDYKQAKLAAGRILSLMELTPKINANSNNGDTLVFDKLWIKINAGENVALVGESGCGKSTIVRLVERFYDPVHGSLILDGHNYKSLNVCWLRQQLGVVSQEPMLFDSSIAENIAYGDNLRDVPMDEIIKVARMANIHTFIQTLPELVQKALDAACHGRTCITIAHRLSTIQNADRIIFLHGGRVQEIGTHAELMDRKGMYYKLNLYNAN